MANYALSQSGVISISADKREEVISKSSGLHAFQKEVEDFIIASYSVKDSKTGYPNITFYDAEGKSFRTHVFELLRTFVDKDAPQQDKEDFLAEIDLSLFLGNVANRLKDDNGDLVLFFEEPEEEVKPAKPEKTGRRGVLSSLRGK